MRTNETPLGFVLSPVAFAVTVAASASAAGGCGSGRAVAVPAGAAFGVLAGQVSLGKKVPVLKNPQNFIRNWGSTCPKGWPG